MIKAREVGRRVRIVVVITNNEGGRDVSTKGTKQTDRFHSGKTRARGLVETYAYSVYSLVFIPA